MIRVLVFDDQDLIRAGLRAIIEEEGDIKFVGEANTGRDAGSLARSTEADVVLMDIQMPDADGLVGLASVLALRPTARVFMLTMYDVDDYVTRSLKAGASGFLLKTTPPEKITEAIRDAHAGNLTFAPSVVRRLASTFVASAPTYEGVPPVLQSLTERELEVFSEVARGLSNVEIGAGLFLTEATVKTYVTRILAKLNVRNRVQAVILAYESGWLRS